MDEIFSPLGLERSRYFNLANGEGLGDLKVVPTGWLGLGHRLLAKKSLREGHRFTDTRLRS